MTPGLETEIVNQDAYGRNVEKLHAAEVVLPRISELSAPVASIAGKMDQIGAADPDFDRQPPFKI